MVDPTLFVSIRTLSLKYCKYFEQEGHWVSIHCTCTHSTTTTTTTTTTITTTTLAYLHVYQHSHKSQAYQSFPGIKKTKKWFHHYYILIDLYWGFGLFLIRKKLSLYKINHIIRIYMKLVFWQHFVQVIHSSFKGPGFSGDSCIMLHEWENTVVLQLIIIINFCLNQHLCNMQVSWEEKRSSKPNRLLE